MTKEKGGDWDQGSFERNQRIVVWYGWMSGFLFKYFT